MKYFSSLPIAILFLSSIAGVPGLDASRIREETEQLQIQGETSIVVTKLPFNVLAPDGYKLYFWKVPSTWKHDGSLASSRIMVTNAPEGTGTVSVDCISKDFDVKSLKLIVSIGKVTPPVPPIPPGPDPIPPIPPAPVDELTKIFQPLYTADTNAEKAKHKEFLVALWKEASKLAKDAKIKTTTDWLKAIQETSASILPKNALIPIRQSIATYLNSKLPRVIDAPLTDAIRATMELEARKVAASLEALK